MCITGGLVMGRKTTLVLLLIGYCFGLFANLAKGDIVHLFYSDGQVHTIDHPMNDTWVHCEGVFTTVNVVEGGSIFELSTIDNSRGMLSGGTILRNLTAFNNSQVEMTGGAIGEYGVGPGGEFCAYDDSQIMVSGGSMNLVEANGQSQATISDGMIGIAAARESGQLTVYGGDIHDLVAFEDGQVTVYGMPSIQIFNLIADNEGIITVHGLEFYIDSQQVSYGEITSIFGGNWSDEPERRLGVIFDDGEFFGTSFYIGHNSSIVLVPEPATLLLTGFGILMERWVRKTKQN